MKVTIFHAFSITWRYLKWDKIRRSTNTTVPGFPEVSPLLLVLSLGFSHQCGQRWHLWQPTGYPCIPAVLPGFFLPGIHPPDKCIDLLCHFVIHIICTSIYISTACMVKEFSSTNIRSQNFPIIPWNSENVITGIILITVEAHIFVWLKFRCF